MTEHRRLQLADFIRELTEPHTHVETYQTKSIVGPGFIEARHITQAPSLMAQLWANDVPSAAVEEGPRPGFASKPAARIDALDAAVRIDIEASRWVRDLGEDDPSDTVECLRRLHGLAASADQVTRRSIEHDARGWWIRARIVTGWDSPAWSPDNTCPQCGERGTLRIRLADRIATCTHDPCRVTWDPTSIGLLADHIRDESNAERIPRQGMGPCQCPLPRPELENLNHMCPRCGSAWCTNALQRRLIDSLRRHDISA